MNQLTLRTTLRAPRIQKCGNLKMAARKKYTSSVLIGNWLEDRVNKYDLFLQKTKKDNTYEAAEELLRLMSSNKTEHIENPGVSPFYERNHLSPSRSSFMVGITIKNIGALLPATSAGYRNIINYAHQSNALFASCSDESLPSVRNVFRIASCYDGMDGQRVLYGHPIMFVLYVNLSAKESIEKEFISLYLATDFNKLGYTSGKMGAQSLFFEINEPTYMSQWKIEPEDPVLRESSEGEPILVNDRVLIRHMRTNKPLALETNCQLKTAFGFELGVSANTYLDSHKMEKDVNVWKLVPALEKLYDAETTTPERDDEGHAKESRWLVDEGPGADHSMTSD